MVMTGPPGAGRGILSHALAAARTPVESRAPPDVRRRVTCGPRLGRERSRQRADPPGGEVPLLRGALAAVAGGGLVVAAKQRGAGEAGRGYQRRGAQRAAAAVLAYRRTPAEIAAALQGEIAAALQDETG